MVQQQGRLGSRRSPEHPRMRAESGRRVSRSRTGAAPVLARQPK
jgi:hypothetical protein